MTMPNESEIRRAFRAKLKTTPGLPGPDFRAWENHPFDLPDLKGAKAGTTVYVREWLRVLTERKSAVALIETVGETLWGVYAPKGRGTRVLDDLSKAIAESFEAGQSLVTASGAAIILERTTRSDLRQTTEHPAWVFKAVTTRWRVFTQSST